MKLSHLSLAIFSAIALAACGGSSNGDQTTPDAGAGNTGGNTGTTPTPTPKPEPKPEPKPDVPQEDAEIVDPTRTKVVDDIALASTSTTASQQYIRGEQSTYDRTYNPSNDTPASATALSGITLNVQNPNLTNIVIARLEQKNNKDEDVKVALFAGSYNAQMPSLDQGQNPDALQWENQKNAVVASPNRWNNIISGFGWKNLGFKWANYENRGFVTGESETLAINPLFSLSSQNLNDSIAGLNYAFAVYADSLQAYEQARDESEEVSDAVKTALNTAAANLKEAAATYNGIVNDPVLQNQLAALKVKSEGTASVSIVKAEQVNENSQLNSDDDFETVLVSLGPDAKDLRKFGYGIYPFIVQSEDSRGYSLLDKTHGGWGDRVTPSGVVGTFAGEEIEGGPTHGLVGIYNDSADRVVVRGADDNNIRTTRIFGHYYRDPGSFGGKLLPETANSWLRPVTFITDVDGRKATEYGFGAEAMVLEHVQYGRVTANIADIDFLTAAGTNGWRKVKQEYDNRDPEKLGNADDFYFYRGTGETSVADMAKLPTDTKIKYEGHALMYGIDNKFHGGGQVLPNAFGNTNTYGLGNFVAATLDMGAKKFDGSVFNAWHSPNQKNGIPDVLVTFSGDVIGNTVIGEASRTYVTENRPADFRASFYGKRAQEVGGAFNAVKREDPYGEPSWGGVFGAKKTISGGTSWLVSSEEK